MPQRMYETCTLEGCTRKHKAAGYCATHYAQNRRGFAPTPIKPRDRRHDPICGEAGCDQPVKAKGLCKMHYARLLRHGFTTRRDRTKPAKPCSVGGCESHSYTNGMCNQHHLRARKAASFGMTLDQVEAIIAAQDGKCAICKQGSAAVNAASGKTIDLHLDHDHKTGAFRGILCAHCNRGIGLLQDDPVILRRALAYLETHSASTMPA